MPTFSFTEKEWDKVRPSSVKETGVSKAMRSVLKDVPKDLKALTRPTSCDEAIECLHTLDQALDKAANLVKAVKQDKHDAADKLKTWKAQVKDACEMIALQKQKILMSAAADAADAKMKQLAADARTTITEAKRLAADADRKLKAGQTLDLEELAKSQQEFRKAFRDAHKFATKSGFVDAIKFLDEIHKAGVDASKVPIPPSHGDLKKLLGDLEEAVNELGDLLDRAAEEQGKIDGSDEIAEKAKQIVAGHKEVRDQLKKFAALAKQVESKAKEVADAVKVTDQPDTAKILAPIRKMHEVIHKLEDQAIGTAYRVRSSKGDIAQELATVVNVPGFEPHNKVVRTWRAAVFDALMTVTNPIAGANHQVERALKIVLEYGGTSAAPAQSLEAEIKHDQAALASKYHMGTR